jgi:hypothetical protein
MTRAIRSETDFMNLGTPARRQRSQEQLRKSSLPRTARRGGALVHRIFVWAVPNHRSSASTTEVSI